MNIKNMSNSVRQINIYEENESLDQFLDLLSEKTFSVLGYHYSFYQKMLEEIEIGESYYLGYFQDGNLCAVLPGFTKSTDLGSVYSSMPFFGPNSGVLCENSDLETSSAALLNYLSENLPSEIISASVYSPFNGNSEYLNQWNAQLKIDKFTSYIELTDYTPSSKIRYDIRKSIKSGVIISNEINEDNINALFEIYEQNCADFGIPLKPRKCINSLAKSALNGTNVSFYFAKLNDTLIGGLIMIWSPSVVSYYLPCSLNEFRSLQPNTLLIHQAIEDAKSKKVKIWNWEASPSKDSGVYKFKSKWGGTDIPYKIHLKTFKPSSFYTALDSELISENFPHYYVYPFNQLN
jgi:hypothetical protein